MSRSAPGACGRDRQRRPFGLHRHKRHRGRQHRGAAGEERGCRRAGPHGLRARAPGSRRKAAESRCEINNNKGLVVRGDPDPAHAGTVYGERRNLTVWVQLRRFTRLTNAFSEKVEIHRHALSLYFVWYSFIRMHKGQRMTPAPAPAIRRRDRASPMPILGAIFAQRSPAGATDRLWPIENGGARRRRCGSSAGALG